jgi:hypothetical protein
MKEADKSEALQVRSSLLIKNHSEEGRNLELIMQKNVMISEFLLLFLLL